MAVKKTTLKEFTSDDKVSVIPDPITNGDPHADRVDQGNKEEPRTGFGTKIEGLNAIMSALAGFETAQLSDLYAGLDHGKTVRPLDQNGEVNKDPNSAFMSPTSKLSEEDLAEFFGGENLTEEFQDRITTLFEAAVEYRYNTEALRLQEEFQDKLSEAVEDVVSEIAETVDLYLSAAADKWILENEVALTSAIKVEIAENIIDGVKNLVTENYINLPDGEDDILEAMNDKIEELEARLAEEFKAKSSLQESVTDYETREAFLEISDGLALTQVEKLRTLSEGISYDSVDDFARKLELIKETYFNKKAGKTDSLLTESFEDLNEDVKPAAPEVNGYVEAIRRVNKKL